MNDTQIFIVIYILLLLLIFAVTATAIYIKKTMYPSHSEPLYDTQATLKAKDFEYLLSASDIWHLRRIASHYTSTKPMHSDPRTTALAVTLEGLGTEGQE